MKEPISMPACLSSICSQRTWILRPYRSRLCCIPLGRTIFISRSRSLSWTASCPYNNSDLSAAAASFSSQHPSHLVQGLLGCTWYPANFGIACPDKSRNRWDGQKATYTLSEPNGFRQEDTIRITVALFHLILTNTLAILRIDWK